MTVKIFLDTNLIISAFDTENPEALEKMSKLLSDDSVALFISPLVRYEVLRGIPFGECEKYKHLQEILDGFKELNIDRDISELASCLYQYDVYTANPKENRNFDKRGFDTFHFSTAKCNELVVDSNDSDIDKIEALYQNYLQEISPEE